MKRHSDADRRRLRRLPVLAADRKALAEYHPADPAVVAEATRLKEAALVEFGMESSAIAAWIYSKCAYQIPTTAVPTAAVMASGDGSCLLMFNPDFFASIGMEGVKFVLFHEARHLVQRHLFTEPELRADPVFDLAIESTINHVALVRLGRAELPVLDGEPVGIDPRRIHAKYVADLTPRGLSPLPYDAFIATDMACYTELKRMADPPVPPPLCVHQLCAGDGDGDGGGLLDGETVERITNEVLANVLLAAGRGVRGAREELSDLIDRTDGATDRLSRLWGDLGAGMIRGRTQRTRRVDWWQRWLVDVLASKLDEGERLVYPKKRGAVLAALGEDPTLSRRGPERTKVVAIAVDASGSMPSHVVDWLASLVGQLDGVEAHWLSFDAVVAPFQPGEPLYGGGGTSFQAVADYLEGRTVLGSGPRAGEPFDEQLDAVVMVTDGYAPHITPEEPDKWIWLITEAGDDWPEQHRPEMACHRVRTGDR
jgi:predicted metal-dependent peptidase